MGGKPVEKALPTKLANGYFTNIQAGASVTFPINTAIISAWREHQSPSLVVNAMYSVINWGAHKILDNGAATNVIDVTTDGTQITVKNNHVIAIFVTAIGFEYSS